jgi:hypothetical protein
MFVVVQVRHTLQQAGAIGAYSAARFVIGAARTESRRIMLSVYSPRGRALPATAAAADRQEKLL